MSTRIGAGQSPARPFDFAISTGDNADSQDIHEQQLLLTAFNSGQVYSGQVYFNAAGVEYVGIQDNATHHTTVAGFAQR